MSDPQIAAALGSDSRGSLPVGNPVIFASRGEVHACRRLRLTDGRSVFVKQATSAERGRLLAEEATGLARLASHVRVPAVLAQGTGPDGCNWLAMEWLQLLKMDAPEWIDLGRQLAALHAITRERYGLSRGNFLSTIPQDNTPASDWREFFIERRLRPQLQLAASKGYPQADAAILVAAHSLLHDHHPRPALLHGNLCYWNVGPLAGGRIAFFDPAPYFGDPEIDLARLLWNGLRHREVFLSAYGGLPDGYHRRLGLYQVYDALVRLNIYTGKYPEYDARRLEGSVRELTMAGGVSS